MSTTAAIVFKGCWEKRGAQKIVHSEALKGNTRCYSNYVQGYWPFAGGLSAVNAIGTQLCDLINSGRLTHWRMAVYVNKWTPPRKSGGIPRVCTIFNLSWENGQIHARPDDRTCLPRPNSQARTGTGNSPFSRSADHEHDWQLHYTRLIHTYILLVYKW